MVPVHNQLMVGDLKAAQHRNPGSMGNGTQAALSAGKG